MAIGMDCDALAEFLPDCYEDNHCSNTQKCCQGRCRFKECQNAIFKKKTAIVRLGTSTRKNPNASPAPVLLLAGGGKANELFINNAITRANRYSKPGTCPVTKPSWIRSVCPYLTQSLISPCKTDRDCSGDRKCCPGRCDLMECATAVFDANVGKTKANATGSVSTSKPNVTRVAIAGTKPPSNVIRTVVINRPSNRKPGRCPPSVTDGNSRFLCSYLLSVYLKIDDCKNDIQCPGERKCCPGRCNLNECKTPLTSRGHTRSLFISDGPDLVTDRPDPVRVPPKVASCPVVRLMPTQAPGSQLNVVDLLVCSFVYSTKPTCKRHADCAGQTMCCRTRCDDFRCVDPVLS